jgi:hypothetical protein
VRRRPLAAGVLCALAALSSLASSSAAQSGFVARLSVDTVEVGEVFSLLVRVPVPAGSVVHFPDTLARTDFLESHRPVAWAAEPDLSGGAVVTLEYAVLAWGVGTVPVPGFDVFVQPIDGGAVEAPPLPGGSLVGPWSEAPSAGDPAVRPLRVPRRGVWVNPVFTPEQIEAGAQPMPSADVVGPSWHLPSVLAGLAFLAALTILLARGAPGWLGRLRASGAARDGYRWTPESSRRHALDELDRLGQEGLAASGKMLELYTRSSGVVRQYVSRIKPEHGVDLTSSELMSRLDEGADAGVRVPIVREMGTAEVVKFGRLRPGRDVADEHVRSLRAWVEGTGASTP